MSKIAKVAEKYDFNWTEKELNFYFSRVLLPFHVVHNLLNLIGNRLAPLFWAEPNVPICAVDSIGIMDMRHIRDKSVNMVVDPSNSRSWVTSVP